MSRDSFFLFSFLFFSYLCFLFVFLFDHSLCIFDVDNSFFSLYIQILETPKLLLNYQLLLNQTITTIFEEKALKHLGVS